MKGIRSGLVRFALAGVASLAAAWPAYEFALVSSLRLTDPERVRSQSPGDGAALAKIVDRRIKDEGRYAESDEDTRIALRSLIATPLSRSSLRIIGINADLAGDRGRALTAMQLSDRVSRRDPLAQVWLLQNAATVDDFDGFLRHYHAAVTARPELSSVLQPILVTALKYPQTRAAIRPYLRSNAGWTHGFLAEASGKAPARDLLDMTLPAARWLSDEEYQVAMAQIAYRLAADGQWDDAMNLAETTWGDFDREEFSKQAPSRATSDERLGRLAWSLTNSGGISARISQDGFLDVSMDPLSRGIIAFREFPLQGGGEYTFTHRVKSSGGGERARLSWRADCVESSGEPGQRVWDQAIPRVSEASTFRSSFSVPSSCNLLTLNLSGTGAESLPASNISITQIELAPGAR